MENQLSRLSEYVAAESPTGDAPALAAFVDTLVSDFTALGAHVERHPGEAGDHLVCRFTGRDATDRSPLLVLAHSDTVWPVGTIARMPWRVESATAHGPGCFDMKGGIVALQSALASLTRHDGPVRPISVVIVADEEIGSPSSRDLIEREAAGSYAALGLEPPHPDGALKTGRWGSTRLRIAVTGREAHAALDPEKGVSAIDELVDLLVGVRGLVAAEDGVLCNIGTLSGGGKTNVVAGQAAAEVGLRFRDAAVEDRVLKAIHTLEPRREGATVAIQTLSNRPAWTPGPEHDALCATIARAGERIGQTVTGRPARGAADTNLTGRLGIPSVDGLGPMGAGAHAAHEQIRIDSLAERAELIAAVLIELSTAESSTAELSRTAELGGSGRPTPTTRS